MISYHKELVSILKNILPTHYEMTITSGLDTPCITYMELSNNVSTIGDTLGYNRISYQIKVWGNNIGVLQEYAEKIDEALRNCGWVRSSSVELYDKASTMIQKVMTYEALIKEQF